MHNALAAFYERDIEKLIEELNLFKDEKNIWKTAGSIKNTSGNLVLHVLGNMNHFIGATLAGTGYVRNRDHEFIQTGVERKDLIDQLEQASTLVKETIESLTPEQLEKEFPYQINEVKTSTRNMLLHFLLHLNYHLGQVNYLRRFIE